MSYVLYIFTVMMSWPVPWKSTETLYERKQRLATVAMATGQAVDLAIMTGRWPGDKRKDLVGYTLATMRAESGNQHRLVHEGRKFGPSGSGCFMQIHPVHDGILGYSWKSLLGTDYESSFRCAHAGIVILSVMKKKCPYQRPASVMSAYMRGSGCGVLKNGLQRERFLWKILDQKEDLSLISSFRGESHINFLSLYALEEEPHSIFLN